MKLVVVETGSDLVVELWNGRSRAASSVLCYPEARAALAAADRAGRLTPRAYRRALDDFEAAHRELHLVAVDIALCANAGELAAGHGLRGYDAVHLASALALGADTTVVTWDKDLAASAARSGCAVAPAIGRR